MDETTAEMVQDLRETIRDIKDWATPGSVTTWQMATIWRAVYYLENYLEKLQEEYKRTGGTKK